MDKSRQYIQMCKTSKEIQSKWEQKPGDFFIDFNNNIACWTSTDKDTFQIKNGFKIQSNDSIITLEKFFWIPRLAQLIESAQLSKKSYRDTSFDFFEWTKKAYTPDSKPANIIFSSIEQLWLGYVMEKKFSKKWAKGLWIKM